MTRPIREQTDKRCYVCKQAVTPLEIEQWLNVSEDINVTVTDAYNLIALEGEDSEFTDADLSADHVLEPEEGAVIVCGQCIEDAFLTPEFRTRR